MKWVFPITEGVLLLRDNTNTTKRINSKLGIFRHTVASYHWWPGRLASQSLSTHYVLLIMVVKSQQTFHSVRKGTRFCRRLDAVKAKNKIWFQTAPTQFTDWSGQTILCECCSVLYVVVGTSLAVAKLQKKPKSINLFVVALVFFPGWLKEEGFKKSVCVVA